MQRALYDSTDVFLLVFSIVVPQSLEEVASLVRRHRLANCLTLVRQWLSDIRKYSAAKVPVILVGNQSEKRDDAEIIASLKAAEMEPLSSEEGQKMQNYLDIIR